MVLFSDFLSSFVMSVGLSFVTWFVRSLGIYVFPSFALFLSVLRWLFIYVFLPFVSVIGLSCVIVFFNYLFLSSVMYIVFVSFGMYCCVICSLWV